MGAGINSSRKERNSAPGQGKERLQNKVKGRFPFPIVGIGASAGGLEPCERLLRSLPKSTGMAFVVVQHLDPTHESRLTEILSHSTSMLVAEAKHGMLVKPDCVYTIPPNKKMSLSGQVLHLEPRRNSQTQHMPVDFFFRSLAAAQKKRAIGIILSGTASDGAAGMRAIKAGGGITFAQDAGSAKYYGMPQSSIAAGAVDFVLRPEEIARYLARANGHSYMALRQEAEKIAPAEADTNIRQLLGLLKKAFGVDFTLYKSSTIHRRIRRRIALQGIESPEAYLVYVQKKPEELQALFRDMFIGVTEFFRDAGMFKALARAVYPAILKDRPSDLPIRIWVPGCSTGEEVYSILISLLEYLGKRRASTPIQVFGTDANDDAIKKARAGKYGKEITSRVSASRVRRFFTKTEGGFQINKAVRDLCVFARHDMIRDAPFSNLDLLSCRNLLIYLNPAAQKKVIPLFHYTLKPFGFLALGSAETVGEYSELFSLKERRFKLYQKRDVAIRPYFEFPYERTIEVAAAPNPPHTLQILRNELDLQRGAADQLILNQFGPPAVLVNERMEILHFRGKTNPYVQPAQGAASLNLLKMAREGLVVDLQLALDAARKKDAPARRDGLSVDLDGQRKMVDLCVVPIKVPDTKERTYLVLFVEHSPGTKSVDKNGGRGKAAKQRPRDESRVARLQQELAGTKAYLQSVIENRESANEELQSLNEEVQSANEELQRTSEELETANEELQSSNEELNTLNDELQHRNRELNLINDDVLNLLNGLNLIVVMLDSNLRIRRFTPAARKTLNLAATDVGHAVIDRMLTDLRLPADIPDLERSIRQVMETATSKEFELQDRTRHWYLLRIRPYVTVEGKVDGSIIALYDVNEAKQRSAEVAEANLRLQHELTLRQEAEQKFHAIVESAPEAIVLSDRRGKITLVNGQVEHLFGYQRKELIGQTVNLLVPARLRRQVLDSGSFRAFSQAQPIELGLDLFGVRKDGGEFPVEISLSPLKSGDTTLVCSIIRDVSQQKALAQEREQKVLVEERNRMARDVHDTLSQGLTGIVLQLESAEAIHGATDGVREHISRARALARENLEQARRSVMALGSLEPENEDLIGSLRQLVGNMRPTANTRVEFVLQGKPWPLQQGIKQGMLRIAQQSLTNALQHAKARTIQVQLAFDRKQLSLEVSDDGQGFLVSRRPPGRVGLRSMEHRAKELGGKLQVKSRPAKGTRVSIQVPRDQAMMRVPR